MSGNVSAMISGNSKLYPRFVGNRHVRSRLPWTRSWRCGGGVDTEDDTEEEDEEADWEDECEG